MTRIDLRETERAKTGMNASTAISDIWPMVIRPPPPTPKMLLIVPAALDWKAERKPPV